MTEQSLIEGQPSVESFPPQFREAVALARDLVTGSPREQRAADALAALILRLMFAEPRAEALAKVAEVCAQADKDARHNRAQLRHSRGHADCRAITYCEGILRVTEAVAGNAARVIDAAPKPPGMSNHTLDKAIRAVGGREAA